MKKIARGTLASALVAVLLSAPAAGESREQWVSHGPSTGGEIVTVAAAPSARETAYAAFGGIGGGGSGVYRTDDGGQSWTWAGDGLPERYRPQFIVVDPHDARVAYAAFDGLYKTMDAGGFWIPVDAALPEGFVNGLAVDPRDGDRIYAATATGVLRSDDGGESWTGPGEGFPPMLGTRAVVVSPTQPDTLYVAVLDDTEHWFVYRSDDAGARWAPTGFAQRSFVYALAVSPVSPAVVYAALKGSVLRSADGGSRWLDASDGLPAEQVVRNLAVGPESVFAATFDGLYTSRDEGLSWTRAGGLPALYQARAVSVPPGDAPDVWLATCCNQGGVYRSRDGGATWSSGTSGLPGNLWVRPVAAHPSRPGTVYAGAYTGAYASVFRGDAGATQWSAASSGIPSGTFMSSLAVSPAAPDVVLAGTYSGGVYRSTDAGRTWSKTPISSASIETLAFSASDPQIVYAAGTVNNLLSGAPAIVFRSADAGQTWTGSSTGFPPLSVVVDLAVDPTDANIVYAAGSWSGMYKSIDGGRTWVNVSGGLGGLPVISVALDPATPSTVYAAAGSIPRQTAGVYKSASGGLGWTPTALLGAVVSSIVVDPANPQRLYAALPQDAAMLRQSSDAGASWEPFNDGLDPAHPPVLLDVQADGKRLYAGTYGRGVFTVAVG